MASRNRSEPPAKRPRLFPRMVVVLQAVALLTVLASMPSTTSASSLDVRQTETRSNQFWAPNLGARHGDHEGDEDVEHEMHIDLHSDASDHATMDASVTAHESASTSSSSVVTPSHTDLQALSHTSHAHMLGHAHVHAPHPYDGIPDASEAGPAMLVVPPLPHGAGGHSHGTSAPKEVLNETAILRGKGPDPLSYVEWDFAFGLGKPDELERFASAYGGGGSDEKWSDLMGVTGGRFRRLVDERKSKTRRKVIKDIKERVKANKEDPGRHGFIMSIHIVGCVISCFLMLPAALALRAASSNLAPFASLVYLITLSASLLCSMMYKAMTPRLYPSNSHSGLGYTIFWMSLITLGGDVFRLVKQIWINLARLRGASRKDRFSTLLKSLSVSPRRGDYDESYNPYEEERMLSDDGADGDVAREYDVQRPSRTNRQGSSVSSGSASPQRSVHFEEDVHTYGGQRRSSSTRSFSRDLPSPSSTLLDTPRISALEGLPEDREWKQSVPAWRQADVGHNLSAAAKPRFSVMRSILRYTHVTLARSIPILAFAAAYTGLSVYTGSCRGPYKNVCLAHGIKGGIFFWYGLLTFGRYLGAYADMGWAWNRKPGVKKGMLDNSLSAEWIESLVIFIYGATNTWMERFGAAPGDPYTVKQVQHISIAVMFWFAGLMGMVLETKSLKRLLALPVAIKQTSLSHRQRDLLTADEVMASTTPPPSYGFSFNPFPALVIGVTGVAMGAHHQDYVYEVSIHSLWGGLLAGFAVLRMMTYFLLWLRPPTSSIMPSRPPTEAMASFCLALGGLIFMLSSEEVSFVAMRNGFGDFMMILNVSVAFISLLFCETAGLMVLKAWAVKREHMRGHAGEEIATIHLDGQEGRSTTFIIGAEEEEREQDEKRKQFSSSPEQV